MDAAHKIKALFIPGGMDASFLATHVILAKIGRVSSP